MPLKHATETFLVFLLGAVILLTGLLLTTLPDLPAGAVPWTILFVLSILYPLALFALFRRRRADHAFRLLHWFPALMLLLWLGVEIVALEVPRAYSFIGWYTWGWTLPAVTIAFILLISYCLQVVRRRLTRVVLLLAAFIPFVGGALASERATHWDRELASVLWGGEWLQELEGKEFLGIKLAGRLPTEQNLSASSDAKEEEWRVKLRQAEDRRKQAREERLKSTSSSSMRALVPSLQPTSEGTELKEAKTQPTKLPSSGPEAAVFALMMLAGYTGVLHDRARRRRG
ncbi:MAG TPA: hypothetical protein DEB30_02780 [Candidatus Peribacter riflensis]|uniref:Uncharacterized protein n=1 Tax=Candidatus Peribacter riflensis TaxID=1735162 RepID=A0A0S1SNT7_9BACT|nr:MAG: hypothetical protein PeribacterA2_0569 [Candidatus Peribacter riflensis]ALM11047.1 MAG: hypothetical protein PeribacterB2_0568 [Candidatus Peribacter riflensis]ALM12150.1 MAG: hypothetical protein PeribacterC2_0568 [Candidatus Peribacter riflensis]ALM13253.1 MAG: hypothetical protein PeribacterD1_0569 [Candidatus Peribacter riflensis]ALM14353.1 MAG: hypothetical protein PeribacterD2_0568 [Candidatus Peribacter riflensis]